MKYFFTALFFCSFLTLQAQQVSDYKYIIIPERFTDFNKNHYKLNTYLKNLLSKKGYTVILENSDPLPTEVKNNYCAAITADINKVKSMFNNKLELVFKDCEKKEIGKFEGSSAVKDIERGNQDALKIASDFVLNSNPKANNLPQIPTTLIADVDTDNIFINDNIRAEISELKDGSFLLIDKNNAQVLAQFFPSSQPNIFHVKVGEYYTIGFFDGKTITIENKTANNQWTPQTFQKEN